MDISVVFILKKMSQEVTFKTLFDVDQSVHFLYKKIVYCFKSKLFALCKWYVSHVLIYK